MEITIKSNRDRDLQIEELQIDIAALGNETREAVSLLDFERIETLGKIIVARSKAIQMWNAGVEFVGVSY